MADRDLDHARQHSNVLHPPDRANVAVEPRVTILMGTFNGARFLSAQLASIERQTHRNWKLIVSDDGSTDDTCFIVDGFARRISQTIELRQGPRRGPAANFLALAADPSITGDCFAFADQDDVWHPNKLVRGLQHLPRAHGDVAAIYGGRTKLVAADGNTIGLSRLFARPPSFGNALVQNIAGANTMLFNGAAKRLFERAGPLDVISHDWWAYQLVVGSGGTFVYDPAPFVDYRQHDANSIGGNRGLVARWKRFRMALKGEYARWNDVNVGALQQARELLTGEARRSLDQFLVMREGPLTARLRSFARSKARRQTFVGNIGLLAAVAMGKV